MNEINIKPNPTKMKILKLMVLSQMLPKNEVSKLYDCDYEFTVHDNNIIALETWFNAKGKHNYNDKYRKEFKMKPIPVSFICD
jgi:hypothetical protein